MDSIFESKLKQRIHLINPPKNNGAGQMRVSLFHAWILYIKDISHYLEDDLSGVINYKETTASLSVQTMYLNPDWLIASENRFYHTNLKVLKCTCFILII